MRGAGQLGQAQVGTAGHTDPAGRPRLPPDPLLRVEPVLAFAHEGVVGAPGVVPPTAVLDQDGVAAPGQAPGLLDQRRAVVVVRRPHQDRRERSAVGREVEVGGQVHPVAHRHLHVEARAHAPGKTDVCRHVHLPGPPWSPRCRSAARAWYAIPRRPAHGWGRPAPGAAARLGASHRGARARRLVSRARLPPTAYRLPPTAYRLPPTAYRLPPTARTTGRARTGGRCLAGCLDVRRRGARRRAGPPPVGGTEEAVVARPLSDRREPRGERRRYRWRSASSASQRNVMRTPNPKLPPISNRLPGEQQPPGHRGAPLAG